MRKHICIVTLACISAMTVSAITAGWDNVNPDRKEFPPQKVLWTADFASAKLECREGAQGSLRVVNRDGKSKLEIVKKNDLGYLLVTAPAFEVKKNAKLRTYAYCECSDGDSEEGGACLRLWGKTEDLSYFKGLDGRGPGGPRMDKMVNATPGTRIRKLAHRLADAKTGTSITAAIVVSGPRSTSLWSDWGVEDLVAAEKAWAAYRKKLEPPAVDFGMQDEAAFAAALARDRDHTAALANDEGFTKLRIDGEDVPPMIFKGQVQKDGRITYAGGLHDKEGVNLQCVSVRFGRTEKNPLGLWTKDGFDVAQGVELVRKAMRLAPNSVFILQLALDAYPEWCERHPDEIWTLADGRKVYGQHVHADFHIEPTLPKGKWHWPSYHSLVWRQDVKDCISQLVAELKRTGLAKRIVGVHLAGYHDAQFATRHPDFSAPAVAAFAEWQRMKFGSVKWREAPVFGKEPFLDPVKDAHQVAYLTFVKQGPFHMQEDLARHIRSCFGKDIVIGRYCMGWGAAAFNGALDQDPFVLSKDIDFLVAQPSYSHRVPGVAIGSRIPTRSYHHHGKLFVNEFDLRTYGGVHGQESELRVLGLSQATDFPMWQSIHRKLAGMMIAQRMGWWYLDMSGTWFSPPEIVKDIGLIHSQLLAAEAVGKTYAEWRPSVAVAIDEAGMLLRNSIGHYYSSDEKKLQEQVRVLSGSGVPYDMWLADDFVREPKLATGYKVVVFSDMHYRDAAREALLKRLAAAGVTCLFLDPAKRLSPTEFAAIVRKAGGYVPTSCGLEVDMSGSFISLHALKGGRYDFQLPRTCAAYNMKSGKREANGEKMSVELLAGETCWFALGPYVPQPESVPALDPKADRAQMVKLFSEREYGVRRVERPKNLAFETAPDVTIMNGKGVHRAVTIRADGPKAPFSFKAHAYLPKGVRPRGTFVLIYLGQRIAKDAFDPGDPWPDRHHLPVGDILKRGYSAVMFNNWDVAMDSTNECFKTGVFKAWGPASEAERRDSDWGAISAWAWGASRVLDWIETQGDLDATRVAVIGHSRGGKTALWAGVTDSRFALACVNDSGCSGAKLNHVDLPDSEHIRRINTNFPHWFCRNYRACNDREMQMDFDQHQLVALMAPRGVAVASATRDDWAGQPGEFLSCQLASPAWAAQGKQGLIAPDGMPAPDRPLQQGTVSYHIRTGKHDLAPSDWSAYMDFADKLFAAEKTPMDRICDVRAEVSAARKADRKAVVRVQPTGDVRVDREIQKFCDGKRVIWCGEPIPEAPTNSPAIIPLSRVTAANNRWTNGVFGVYWWLSRVKEARDVVAASGGEVDLVMLGDSISHFWPLKHPEHWARFVGNRKVANFGCAGDKVANVLWMVENGALDGYRAKKVSILIGTNDNTRDDSDPARVAEGIRKAVRLVRAKQPEATIVLNAIFPRGGYAGDKKHLAARARNERTNALIKDFAEKEPNVVWSDLTSAFLDANGFVPKTLMADRIHPTEAGYDIWSAVLK